MPTLRLTRPFTLLRLSSLARLPARILFAASLARSRRSLKHLDDHLLRDIGLTRDEAQREAGRPAWDSPAHWKD